MTARDKTSKTTYSYIGRWQSLIYMTYAVQLGLKWKKWLATPLTSVVNKTAPLFPLVKHLCLLNVVEWDANVSTIIIIIVSFIVSYSVLTKRNMYG